MQKTIGAICAAILTGTIVTTGPPAQAQRAGALQLGGQAGPIGGVLGDGLVVVGLLLPAVQMAREAARFCDAQVTIDIIDARNLGGEPLATTGQTPAAAGDTISLNFEQFVSSTGGRLDVLARVTVVPTSSIAVDAGTWAAVCRQAASAQLVDLGTGRSIYIDDIIIGFVGQDLGG